MLIFDIGANIGSWSKANSPNNRIVALEASPTTFPRLVANTAGLNIECLNYAVTSSTDPVVDFYESQWDVLSTLDRAWLTDPSSRFYNQYGNLAATVRTTRVPTITLDALVAKYGVPALLKVDVEGAENIVIRSLTKKVQTLCFEWATEWNDKTFECIDHLVSLGYTAFHIQNQDAYTYRPMTYEYNAATAKTALAKTVNKVDWGMLWCV